MKQPERDANAWREHEEEQRRRWLTLTPLERLRWLDGAKRFVAITSQRRSAGEARKPEKRST